jgi:hypothetical protein
LGGGGGVPGSLVNPSEFMCLILLLVSLRPARKLGARRTRIVRNKPFPGVVGGQRRARKSLGCGDIGAAEPEPRESGLAAHKATTLTGSPRRGPRVIVQATLAYTHIDDLYIVVHPAADPAPEHWTPMIDDVIGLRGRLTGCLVVAGNIKLDARQRSQLAEALRDQKIRVAVLISSPVSRGIVTALGWLVGGYRAFEMSRLEDAIDYLGISVARSDRVRVTVAEMRQRLNEARKAAVRAAK